MAERRNSEARIRSNNKWTNANYDRINIAVKKGRKDVIQAIADTQGKSVNAYVVEAIDEKLERDSSGTTSQKVAGGSTEAGAVSLPSEALETAQGAADRTGEAATEFIARAIDTQAQRDKGALQMGINPATGKKLQYRKEGGTAHE